jgi:hypothetical protein
LAVHPEHGEHRRHEKEGRQVGAPHSLSSSSVLSIWGDPVVGRALALLLRSFGYEGKFLSTLPLAQPLPLKGSSLLLLTPTPQLSTRERHAFLASLTNASGSANIPVLELSPLTEETPAAEEMRESSLWHIAPWPCRIEELKRRIEAISSHHYSTREQSTGGAAKTRELTATGHRESRPEGSRAAFD